MTGAWDGRRAKAQRQPVVAVFAGMRDSVADSADDTHDGYSSLPLGMFDVGHRRGHEWPAHGRDGLKPGTCEQTIDRLGVV